MIRKLRNLFFKAYAGLTEKKWQEECRRKGVIIGAHTYGHPEILQHTNAYHVEIGKFCSISRNVKIFVDVNHRVDWVTTFPLTSFFRAVPANYGHPVGKGNVIIGNDVWIGQDVSIMSGITIGNGAVIAAGSVVTKSVAPYEIVGGNPAKHIRFRFSEEQIRELQAIGWWDWDMQKIIESIDHLEATDINSFIERYAAK
jgi:lipopolysaccharide transport system ATP-binding protein